MEFSTYNRYGFMGGLQLKGAITAYDENKNLEELLVGTIARSASVADQDDVMDRALKIISAGACRASIT